MLELGHALQCVFLSNTLCLLYFLMFAPFFTRGMQTGELFGLLSNRSGSLSTKLVTESKADVIFPNIFFYNDIQALLILSYFALLHFKDIAFLQTERLWQLHLEQIQGH